ncbi:MAG: glycosyltransferase family 2 protein [Candidatus ainarchaeum sp.]|nr:glycosyltransferase family 2 protein [Candidatus ainarchaeum sp.]
MIFEILVAISGIVTVYSLINSLVNLRITSEIYRLPKTKERPLVSILVPARNEEANIAKCVQSLLDQNYSNFEIVVLNDNSTDKTGEILDGLKKKNKNLKVISGKPLPKGWLGKNWACHQLSENAVGDYYLFTDADTIHTTDMLISVVSAAKNKDLEFISMLPKYPLGSWFEKVILPFISFFYFILSPLYVGQKYKQEYLSLAIGQFLFFSKKAYDQIGGYSRIRAEFLDDTSFVRITSTLGLNWRFYNGSRLVSCRLYHNFKEVFHGFTKNAYGFFNAHLFVYIVMVAFLLTIFFSPLAVIIAFILGKVGFLVYILAVLIIVMNIYIFSIVLYKVKIRPYYSVYYLFSIFCWLIITFFSVHRYICVFNKGIGRNVYDHQKGIKSSSN